MKRQPEPRPLLPFRVHFEDRSVPPFDCIACDRDEAEKKAAARHPGILVNKVKIVREKI
jgi:hypothetical protein